MIFFFFYIINFQSSRIKRISEERERERKGRRRSKTKRKWRFMRNLCETSTHLPDLKLSVLMLKKGYILRDPDLVPIARSLWIGSNATAVGWCGNPCLNVWNIKAFVSFHVSCFSQLKVYSTPQGLQNKRYKVKDSIVPFSFQYKYIWLILYNNFNQC